MNDRAYAAAPPSDMIGVFATGARFDLLVLGFVLLPPAVLGPILAVMNRFTPRAMRVFRGYLALAWWAISISALTDLLYFLVHARRMSVFDWKGLDAGTLVSDAVVWEGWGTVIMGAVIVACAAALGARAVLSMAPSKSRGGPVSFGRGFVLALAPLLVAGLMARGTVTPHHLERAHAEVFSGPLLTELALNAVWCFDKEPVGP